MTLQVQENLTKKKGHTLDSNPQIIYLYLFLHYLPLIAESWSTCWNQCGRITRCSVVVLMCNYSNAEQLLCEKSKLKNSLKSSKDNAGKAEIKWEWRRSSRHLQIGLSVEAGCGDVTGAVGTIWWQQHQIGRKGFIFGHTNDVTDLSGKKEKRCYCSSGVCWIKHLLTNEGGSDLYCECLSYKNAEFAPTVYNPQRYVQQFPVQKTNSHSKGRLWRKH